MVQELPRALLKMASGLISPIGHRRQLCNAWISGYVGDLDDQVDEHFMHYVKLQFVNKVFILLLKNIFLYS